ncbi:MAG: hypothetical protein KKB34_11215 [Bacteroidetes bacterium]|nr:hypothetical protein [Bacteroidota bacterium]
MKTIRKISLFVIYTSVLLMFFNTNTKAQYLTKEKLTFFATALAYSFIEGYTEGYMAKEKLESDPAKRLQYNQKWHKLKGFREISTIGTGVAISLDSEFDPLKLMSNLFVTASFYWLIHDELINRVNGWDHIPFGYTSKSAGGSFDNGSFMDQFANPYFKVLSILLSLTINILISG